MKNISILGSTGSIGGSTLDVIAMFPESFRVSALSACENIEKLEAQIRRFKPAMVSLNSGQAARVLRDRCSDLDVEIVSGVEGLIKVSTIFQVMECGRMEDLHKIILTASWGPFLKTSHDERKRVTVEDALRHPNWNMGAKVTIDSATLMNKGLEVIEARWLFDVSINQIEVLIHQQSIIHSMVEFRDGSVLSQMGIPDMRIPIAYALSYPERLDLVMQRLDLSKTGMLTFERPDLKEFPCLSYAFDVIRPGGAMTAVLNSPKEVAVKAFLGGRS